MQNFIAQSMRRFGLAPENKSAASSVSPSRMGQSNAPLAHMEVGSKWSYSTLQYPLDIQSRTDLGHYMMFYINVPNNSEFGRKGGVGDKKNYVLDDSGDEDLGSRTLQEKQVMGDAKISTKSKDGHYDAKGQSWKPGTPNKVIDRAAHQGTAATAVGQNRTKRTTDSIVLYMPPQLTSNYASGYKEQYNLLRFNKNILSTESDYKNNTLNIINSNQFIEAFEPLLQDSKKAISIEHNNLTLRRDCRHEVNVFDSPAIDKKEYKRLNDRIIESIFTTYGYNDPYSYYLIQDRPK